MNGQRGQTLPTFSFSTTSLARIEKKKESKRGSAAHIPFPGKRIKGKETPRVQREEEENRTNH